MLEEWRSFRDGLYEVSNYGRVRRAVDGVNTHAGRMLSLCKSSNGYLLFVHHSGSKHTNILVHRAVAEVFLGPCPVGYEVNHLDGDKLNPRLDNLEYLTRSENSKHALKMGLSTIPTERSRGNEHWTRLYPELVKRGNENGAHLHPECIKRGDDCPASRLTSEQVLEIRKLSAEGFTRKELATKFNVSYQNIDYIIKRLSWRHI